MNEKAKKEIEDFLGEGWVIEESVGSLPKGIVKLRTPKGKTVYGKGITLRVGDGLEFGFEFLSAEDCKKLNIHIEESYGEALEGLDAKEPHYVEESGNEDLMDSENESIEEYMARMKAKVKSGKLSEEQFQKLLEKTKQVIVHMPKGTELKSEETEKLKRFFEGARNKLIEKLKEHGTDIPESQIKSMEDIQVFAGILKDLNAKGKGSSSGRASGTVPLSSQSAGEDDGFDSMQEMIEHLTKMSKEKGLAGSEAKKVLRDLWLRKLPMAVKNRKIVMQIPTDKQIAEGKGMKELIAEEYRRKKKKRLEGIED